jgi:hypothetical protein
VNAVWFWRATVTPAATPYRSADGGKMLVSVTYEAMFDAARPEGHKLYTIGDPTNRGIAVLI